MHSIKKIAEIAKPIVDGIEAFIVELGFRGNDSGKILELFVDTDSGINTEQCAEISRELSRALDDANIIPRRYHLMVSSPGIDRPLKLVRQYPRNIGRKLDVTYSSGLRTEQIEGVLVQAMNDQIVLQLPDESRRNITITSIVEARVKAPW